MKRTWFTVFMCLAMASGAMPKTTSAQTPPITSCPLADYEPYCDYGPEARYALPHQQAADSRSSEPGARTVHGPTHDLNLANHFWDGYVDYLKGLYPYDYYDDTAELSRSPSAPETRDDGLATWHAPHAPNPDFADGEELEFDGQSSPFYGIESSVAPLANGEYSPLYGIEEANQWADTRDDSQDVAKSYDGRRELARAETEGDAVSHDDIALSDESLKDDPAEVVGEEDYAFYDDNSVPYEGDDEYWDQGYWDGVSYDDAPAEVPAAPAADNPADMAHREYQEHGYEYEYDYDNYEYWYGDDNNAPPVQTANSEMSQSNVSDDSNESNEDRSLTYDAEFYQRYEAEVRPAYSEEHQPPLEAMPETNPAVDSDEEFDYDDYDNYGYGDYGYDDYGDGDEDQSGEESENVEAGAESPRDDAQLEYEDYGPEYGYEYEYGNEYDAGVDQGDQYPVDNSREWNSGIDDLYASEADVSGDTQAPADSWFDDDAWNNALETSSSDASTPSDAETQNWGEGDFYEMHDAQLPDDYESQWDGTASPSPQPAPTTDDTADLYEESWFEHNDRDYESDYEPSNDYSDDATAATAPHPTTREPDYWEEYSDYVEPHANRGVALDHGQYWYGDEGDWEAWESDESMSQFMPADSPLPESYWPEEYQPYDMESASDSAEAQTAPYMLLYAARATISPLWWATGSVREHWLPSLSKATENLQDFWGNANRQLQPQVLPPLEVLPNASDDWNCDQAWDTARPEEVTWDD